MYNIEAQSTREVKKITEWEVLTPEGWSNFSSVKKITKPYYVEIKLNNNLELKGSPYHKVKMLDDSFKYLISIKKGEKLVSGAKVIFKKKVVEEVELFDLLDVEKNSEYYTNNIVSHNCLGYRTAVTVRNIETGEVRKIKIGELIDNNDFS
jgi:intein/homing endonuclease